MSALPRKGKPTGELDESALQRLLGYRMAQASVVTRGIFIAEVGEPLDLRPVDYTLLALVRSNPGVPPSRLAQALSVTAPNITLWIDRLAARGLLARERSVTDKRSQHIHLTPEGDALVAGATRKLLQAEKRALSALTEGERTLLAELLHKVARCRPRS